MSKVYVLEKQIQFSLNKEYKGELEKYVPIGRIDILTDTEVIEIKTADKWKEGVGQLYSYECYLREPRKKVLVLFGFIEDTILDEIKRVCTHLQIELRLVTAEINLLEVSTLRDEFNYISEETSTSKVKKRKRIDIYLENIDKTNNEILELLKEVEPDTSTEALSKWIKRHRDKVD